MNSKPIISCLSAIALAAVTSSVQATVSRVEDSTPRPATLSTGGTAVGYGKDKLDSYTKALSQVPSGAKQGDIRYSTAGGIWTCYIPWRKP